MFVSLKANKKRIIAFLVLAAVAAAGCFFLKMQGAEPKPAEYFGETGEERISFLESFGWQVDPEPTETREVMIPAEFNDVYQNYNAMQQAQGFDLAPYAGQVCTQYKYHVSNYPGETEVYATLLVQGRLIIGGDLACAQVDGFMHGFAKDSARYGEATPRPSATKEPEGYVNSSAVENSSSGLSSTLSPSSSAASGQDADASPEGAQSSAVDQTGAQAEYPTD